MNIGHIQGGTNAGWRKIREARKPWFCSCLEVSHTDGVEVAVSKLNPGYRGRCDECGEARPES